MSDINPTKEIYILYYIDRFGKQQISSVHSLYEDWMGAHGVEKYKLIQDWKPQDEDQRAEEVSRTI